MWELGEAYRLSQLHKNDFELEIRMCCDARVKTDRLRVVE